MSQSNQDTGAWFVIVIAVLLVILGGGYVAYRSLMAQRAARQSLIVMAESERQQAMAEAARAEASRQELTQRPGKSASEDDETVFQSIQSKLAEQQATWNKGDLEAFMQVYWKSDRLTFASGGKVTRGWQATLDGYKAKYSTKEKLGTLTFGDLEFQRLDKEVALVLGTWHLARGADSVGGNFSLVWRKIDDQWLIIHDHTSALPKTDEQP